MSGLIESKKRYDLIPIGITIRLHERGTTALLSHNNEVVFEESSSLRPNHKLSHNARPNFPSWYICEKSSGAMNLHHPV